MPSSISLQLYLLLELCLLATFVPRASATSIPEEIFHNMVLAAQADDSKDVLRHWMLYQRLNDEERLVSQMAQMLPLLWQAIDRLDLCPQNIPADSASTNLWLVATYNYLARHSREISEKDISPADSLSSFRNREFLRSVNPFHLLEKEEILSLKPVRTSCSLISDSLPPMKSGRARDKDSMQLRRKDRVRLVLSYLERVIAKTQMHQGLPWLQARQLALKLFLSDDPEGIATDQQELIKRLVREDAKTLKAMEPDLRRYLMQLYQKSEEDPAARKEILLRWLSLALDWSDQALLEQLSSDLIRLDPVNFGNAWDGSLGQRLLQATEQGIFSEGSSVALARALHSLDNKSVIEALRMLSTALHVLPRARSEDAGNLAKAWIDYTLIQYRFDKRFLDFLRVYLDTAYLRRVIQDLTWTSAFMGESQVLEDKDYIVYLSPRLKQLAPFLIFVAHRRFGEFMSKFQHLLSETPYQAMGIANELLTRLRLEPFPVVKAMLPLMRQIHQAMIHEGAKGKSQGRRFAAVAKDYDAFLVHSEQLSQEQQDRQVRGDGVVDLGAIRVPPSHVVPWNFQTPDRVSVELFREIPYRLRHVHEGGGISVLWDLGPP